LGEKHEKEIDEKGKLLKIKRNEKKRGRKDQVWYGFHGEI
jgi:hypothetical protein